ncbi:GNAT family acetyltransferase [Agrococcus sp. ARC_14]|uniref:GNAT family acetyltransferase n=1 Tax=Agrococcus sp. ARC_14 TaxID=2919927 RepID=UPI001F06CFD8|nr:GNAT family acetyltransferase [Agrococcus sp. ARC_14]MCH1883393.1 GNAT family acetyltransferase [Agrococcus sp. ARC_14]
MTPVEALGHGDAGAAIALWHATGLTRPWNVPETDFARAVDGATSAVLGIRDGDALVATAMVGHDGHRGWVYYLAVDPARQRQGLGAALMRAAEAWIVAAGGVKLQLMVRAGNDGVLDFYRALGYDDQGVTVLGRRLDPPLGPGGGQA